MQIYRFVPPSSPLHRGIQFAVADIALIRARNKRRLQHNTKVGL